MRQPIPFLLILIVSGTWGDPGPEAPLRHGSMQNGSAQEFFPVALSYRKQILQKMATSSLVPTDPVKQQLAPFPRHCMEYLAPGGPRCHRPDPLDISLRLQI
jgi:hypothetical protein